MEYIETINIPEQKPKDIEVKVETPEKLVNITDNINRLKVGIEKEEDIIHKKDYSLSLKESRFVIDYRARKLEIPNPTTSKHIIHTREEGEHIVYETNKLVYCEVEHDVRPNETFESYVRIESTYDRKKV